MNAPNNSQRVARPLAGSAGRVLLVVLGTALVIAIIILTQRSRTRSEEAMPAPPAATTPSMPGGASRTAATPAQAGLVQAALDKANAANVRIQSDLDKAKSEAADLKSRLAQANAASDQLQAQVEAGHAEAAGLRGQIEKANSDANGLRAELASTQSQRTALEKRLELATAQGSDLQARLRKSEAYAASIQPLLARARHLPIHTSSEKVLGSPFELVNGRSSYTLHVSNLSLEPINVDLTIVTAGHTISQSNTIAGGATLNIERLAAGAKVSIGSDTYETVSLTVP